MVEGEGQPPLRIRVDCLAVGGGQDVRMASAETMFSLLPTPLESGQIPTALHLNRLFRWYDTSMVLPLEAVRISPGRMASAETMFSLLPTPYAPTPEHS